MATLADRIKSLRKSAGLTQKELGEVLGIAKNTISQYENGQHAPNDEIKIAITNHFNVSMDYLMGKTDDPGFDSKTPTVFQSQVEKASIDTIHAYVALSAANRKRVEEYVQMLSEWEKAYLKPKRSKKPGQEES